MMAIFEKRGLARHRLGGSGAPISWRRRVRSGACAEPSRITTPISRIGFRVARALGALDIGQAAVVCEGLVLAVEAAEGTDAMLARVAALPGAVRGTPPTTAAACW